MANRYRRITVAHALSSISTFVRDIHQRYTRKRQVRKHNHGNYGRWAFAEFVNVWEMQSDFQAKVEEHFDEMIQVHCPEAVS
ncbi:MAG: hypothetical protein L0H63_14270 [Nitrococcus sp.]|nr:hypothetical protein [Nitrococcus sp.]